MTRAIAYQIAVLFVVIVVGVVGGVMYVHNAIAKNNRPLCDLLAVIDAPDNPPPDNERSATIAKKIHDMRVRYHCEGV